MTSTIIFYLNGEKRIINFSEENTLTPTTSVLRYLRDIENLTGTKEGCSVGDCGACTICIAELKNETIGGNLFTDTSSTQISYMAVDSCLLPMAALNGKHIFTIEWLSRDGKTHPIQTALAEKRGTQCGFCSPGMVMSAYAHYRMGRPFTREEIEKTISGNLCRCTGYESILEAMLSIGEVPRIRELRPIFDEELRQAYANEIYCEKDGIKYIKPTSLKSLLMYRSQYASTAIIAGSTDMSISIKKGNLTTPVTLIDISEITELKSYEEYKNYIYIGSGTTIENFKNLLTRHYPSSEPYLNSFASLQIRNCGSIGGSISGSSPVGDIMPLLIALDANIILRSEEGKRSIEASSFITSYRKNQMHPDEILVGITIDKPHKNSFLFCHKQSRRKDMDISAMSCSIYFETTSGKITKIFTGFGGMAAIPKGSCTAEEYLTGKEITIENFIRAGEMASSDFNPMTDVRGSAQYRLTMVKNLFIKCYEQYASNRK